MSQLIETTKQLMLNYAHNPANIFSVKTTNMDVVNLMMREESAYETSHFTTLNKMNYNDI